MGRKVKVPEAHVLRSVMEWLQYHPKLGYAYRTNNTGMFREGRYFSLPKGTPKGVPDIHMVLFNGRACYIECKSDTGKMSADQKVFQQRVEDFGGLYIVARSILDVRDVLLPLARKHGLLEYQHEH